MQLLSRLATDHGRMNGGLFGKVKVLAASHRATLARFGRFPENNGLLGRDSTAEEQAYLGHTVPEAIHAEEEEC